MHAHFIGLGCEHLKKWPNTSTLHTKCTRLSTPYGVHQNIKLYCHHLSLLQSTYSFLRNSRFNSRYPLMHFEPKTLFPWFSYLSRHLSSVFLSLDEKCLGRSFLSRFWQTVIGALCDHILVWIRMESYDDCFPADCLSLKVVWKYFSLLSLFPPDCCKMSFGKKVCSLLKALFAVSAKSCFCYAFCLPVYVIHDKGLARGIDFSLLAKGYFVFSQMYFWSML